MACITFSRDLSKEHINAIRKLRPLEMFVEKKSEEIEVNDKDKFRLDCQRQFKKMSSKKRLRFIRKAVDAWEKYVTKENLTRIPTLHYLLNRKDTMFFFKSLGSKEIFRNSYQIFFEEKMKELPDGNTMEKFKTISQMWKNLDSSEKNKIKDRLQKENEDRKKQQASFIDSLSKPLKFEYDFLLQEKQNRKNGNNLAFANESNTVLDNMLIRTNQEPREPKSKAFELFRNKNNLKEDQEALTKWAELRKKKKLKFINKAIKAGEQDEISLSEILTSDDMELLVSSLNIPDNLLNKTHGSHLFIRERDIGDLTLASILWDRLTAEKRHYFESKANEANEQRKAQLDQILTNFIPKHRFEIELFLSNRHKPGVDQSTAYDFILVCHNGSLSPPLVVKNNINGTQSRLSRSDLQHISRLLSGKLVSERNGFLRRISGSSRERFLAVEENLKQLQIEMSNDALQLPKKRIHSPSSMSTISVELKKSKPEKSTESMDSQLPF